MTTTTVLPASGSILSANGSEKKKPLPQRFRQKRSDKYPTYTDALFASGTTVLEDGHRMRIRKRTDGTFDLVIYEPI